MLLPKDGYVAAYAVTASNKLTPTQVLQAVEAPFSDSDLRTLDRTGKFLIHLHPTPGIEVIDCVLADAEIAQAQRDSNRVSYWLTVDVLTRWPFVYLLFVFVDWPITPTVIAFSLALTVVTAGIPWALLYVIRWIVRGFAEA